MRAPTLQVLVVLLLTLPYVTAAAGAEESKKARKQQQGGIPSTGVWRTPGGGASSSLDELSSEPPEGVDPKEWARTVAQIRAQLGEAAPGSNKEEL